MPGGCPLSVSLPVVLFREGRWWVAHCPAIDVASQGRTVEAARKNVGEAIALYMEDEDTAKPALEELQVSITTVNVNVSAAD